VLTKEMNDLLTQTGPGTPCGDLLRRYWQPAALSEELPPRGPPVPVRLLGEDLVLFRDEQGRPGLLGLHCAHRGADLSYGRLEDGGLRCLYHGWLYDVAGRCLEQPGEPAGSTFKDRVRQRAYPCVERSGAIFAYLGPGGPPLLPSYNFLTVPADHVVAVKLHHASNYLHANEGNIDLLHVSFLHTTDRDDMPTPVAREPGRLSGRGPAPGLETIEFELIDGGLRVCKLRRLDDDHNYVRIGTFLLPNLTATPGGQTNWHVPIDDTHHWKYTFIFNNDAPLDEQRVRRTRAEMTPDYQSIYNRSNRYGQDRASMPATHYSGLGYNFQVQDLWAVEGAGPRQDRTEEHLAPSDLPIVTARKLLLRAIEDVQAGRDPAGVFRAPELNRFPRVATTYGTIPSAVSWKTHCDELAREGTGWRTAYSVPTPA
jgi:phenylpropionate dioxygenase-like ring-hydroxylating dioxygenase large terminal subunit